MTEKNAFSRWIDFRIFCDDIKTITDSTRDNLSNLEENIDTKPHCKEHFLAIAVKEFDDLKQIIFELPTYKDPIIKESLKTKGYHKIIATASALRNLAEYWDKFEDKQ